MVFRLPSAQKWIFWAFEKSMFESFTIFWVTKLNLFSGKASQNLQDHLNSKLVVGTFLDYGFEATLRSKTNDLSIWKGKFLVFCKYSVTKLKPFSGKVRQSKANYLNQDLVLRIFLENGLQATLSSRMNILSVLKEHVSVFCKFLSGEVETVFWESDTKLCRPSKFKTGHRNLFRKWFWSNLQIKNEYSEHLNREIFNLLQIFDWRSWNYFLGKWGEVRQTI